MTAKYAITASDKARARRREARREVRIDRELDTYIKRIRGKPRLITREIYFVSELQAAMTEDAR